MIVLEKMEEIIQRMPQVVPGSVLEQMKVLQKALSEAVLVHFYRSKFNTCHTSYEFDVEKGCLQEVHMDCIVRRSKGESVKVLGPHYVQSNSEAMGSKVAGTNHDSHPWYTRWGLYLIWIAEGNAFSLDSFAENGSYWALWVTIWDRFDLDIPGQKQNRKNVSFLYSIKNNSCGC